MLNFYFTENGMFNDDVHEKLNLIPDQCEKNYKNRCI